MKREKSLETLLVLTGALILFFWIFNKKIFLSVALALVLIGAFSPYLTDKISKLWMKLSEILGNVMSKVILSAIFFVFLIPLAWIRKMLGKENLLLKKKNNSYYKNRNHTYSGKDLENMW